MALRLLYGLDKSSAQFPDQLDQFFHDEKHMECIQILPESELEELLDYMDDVKLLLFDTDNFVNISHAGS